MSGRGGLGVTEQTPGFCSIVICRRLWKQSSTLGRKRQLLKFRCPLWWLLGCLPSFWFGECLEQRWHCVDITSIGELLNSTAASWSIQVLHCVKLPWLLHPPESWTSYFRHPVNLLRGGRMMCWYTMQCWLVSLPLCSARVWQSLLSFLWLPPSAVKIWRSAMCVIS